ncbi:hypothetical protein ACFV00_23400 [Streptomyces californicus]|uniref:hypothetical protein n=1 Tax=Streptomyces californicus TaxID=67351 RepID=UPI0036BFA4B3
MTSSHGHAEQDGPGTRAALEGLEGSDEAAQLDARMESLRALQELVRDGGLDTDVLLDKRRYRSVRSI